MSRRRWSYSVNYSGNDFANNIKDYIVPIIAVVLILVLIWSLFFKKENNIAEENRVWISITKDTTDSNATILFSSGSKQTFTEGQSLYKSEKIIVSAWRMKVSDGTTSFNINKLWELKYLENGDFQVDSWDVWIDTEKDVNLSMKFAKLKISTGSHLSISQNEVMSTVYVFSWKVEVSNLKWRSTVLAWMEKIEVARAEASDEKIDLAMKKTLIDDYYLRTDWVTINNGSSYISTWATEEETSSWVTSSGSEEKTTTTSSSSNISWKSKYLTFSNLLDESNISSSPIVISWVYDTEDTSKIEVNGIVATLNPNNWTFKIENVAVANKENDLVFKVYNGYDEVKEKFVYTVYNEWGSNQVTSSTNSGTSFSVDGSKFTFTAPNSSTTYTTNENFVTIRWLVTAQWIDSVVVNGLKLSSFNGKTWRYHASVDYGNYAEWTNIYEVQYYSGSNLVYKNYYTIIKKSWTVSATKTQTVVSAPTTTTTETSEVSAEVITE